MDTTGQRIKQMRKSLDLTQGEFAERLQKRGVKMSTSNLSMIESDDSNATPQALVAIADEAGCSVDYLLLRTVDPMPCWASEGRIVTAVNPAGSTLPKRKQLLEGWIEFLQTLPDGVLEMMLSSFRGMRQELDRATK